MRPRHNCWSWSKVNHRVHFSGRNQAWGTPWPLFRRIDALFGPCELDVCAVAENAKCQSFLSPEVDGLSVRWRGVCWMNPPYGRGLGDWLKKAQQETEAGHARRVVCLIPSRTDTKWWHETVLPQARVIVYIRGRVKFHGAANNAPFPSVVVVFGQLPEEKGSYPPFIKMSL